MATQMAQPVRHVQFDRDEALLAGGIAVMAGGLYLLLKGQQPHCPSGYELDSTKTKCILKTTGTGGGPTGPPLATCPGTMTSIVLPAPGKWHFDTTYVFYTVVAGDTPYTIAQKLGAVGNPMTWATYYEVYHQGFEPGDWFALRAGDTVVAPKLPQDIPVGARTFIPPPYACPKGGQYIWSDQHVLYGVQAGDTPQSIALALQVTEPSYPEAIAFVTSDLSHTANWFSPQAGDVAVCPRIHCC